MTPRRITTKAQVVIIAAILLAGCGYPGEPLPPALNRPMRAPDLSAAQHGSKVAIQFTIPGVSTENLPLRARPDVELRIGLAPTDGFTFPKWEAASERVPASAIHLESVPEPAAPAGRKRKGNAPPPPKEHFTASAELDASKYYGKTVIIGVRLHGNNGQDIGWSRLETLDLVPALPRPVGLAASNIPDGIRVEWHAAAPEYRVFRRLRGDPQFRQLGVSDKPFYLDATIDYGKTYQYQVQAVEKSGERYAESEISETLEFAPVDTFPPAVPTGLTAIPGARTIELVWDRNAERDFSSYSVFRDGVKVAENLTAPAYSDHDVKPGTRYKYQVAAVDTAGNASAPCAAMETAIP